MVRRHLRDIPIPDLAGELEAAGVRSGGDLPRRLSLGLHRRGALELEEIESVGRDTRAALREHFETAPLLREAGMRQAEDGTRKYMFRLTPRRAGDNGSTGPTAAEAGAPSPGAGPLIETVLIYNRGNYTLCVSSQAGCALGCTFCATGLIGLQRNLTAGEITESLVRTERAAGVRVTDVVFMGQGEPLHNYDAVLDACTNLNHVIGHCVSRKRITVSTSGLTPQIRRYADEGRIFRLNLSLHSAVDETRDQIMPISRVHPLAGLIEAMEYYQQKKQVPWVTLQYVALPGVNMDDRHVDALGERLAGLRYILNVIPWNDTSGPDGVPLFRAPSWAEVKDFTMRLRRLNCPVKVRYSAGKREGMGCGQLSAETIEASPQSGHMLAPAGIFSDLTPGRPQMTGSGGTPAVTERPLA